MESCLICDRIQQIRSNINPYFVMELKTGYVVIGDHQFFKGYTLFLCKEHKTELHQLDVSFKREFLEEMSIVGEAVFNAFNPIKLNYELLGNSDAHLHWHIFPRRNNDGDRVGPVWWTESTKMFSDAVQPTSEERTELKTKLRIELEKILHSM